MPVGPTRRRLRSSIGCSSTRFIIMTGAGNFRSTVFRYRLGQNASQCGLSSEDIIASPLSFGVTLVIVHPRQLAPADERLFAGFGERLKHFDPILNVDHFDPPQPFLEIN